MPFIQGNARSGWAVVRDEPRHFVGLYDSEQEANAKAAEMGDGYQVRYGRAGAGSDDVDEAL